MHCPSCREALIVVEYKGVEIDYCTQCEGVWLDHGELSFLLQNKEKEAALTASPQHVGSKEAMRDCPYCERRMKKVLWKTRTQGLTIDACSRKHGLWFDRHELTAIIEDEAHESTTTIAHVLKDMVKKQ